MNKRILYAAHPINTYGTALEKEYLRFLTNSAFCGVPITICDPNDTSIVQHVAELRKIYARDPATGTFSEKRYNEFASAKIMEYFRELVRSSHAGAGLLLPQISPHGTEFVLGAGVALELLTIFKNGYPVFVVSAEQRWGTVEFSCRPIIDIRQSEPRARAVNVSVVASTDEALYDFITSGGEIFRQLSVQETRERIYFWPDRNTLRPYFLE